MELKVIEIIGGPVAISPVEGLKLFDTLKSYVDRNITVELSFEGIEDCISSFCNASIGKLYMIYPAEMLDNLIKCSNYEPIWLSKINNARKLGINENLRNLHEDSLTQILYA